jgi:hypothetical protein
VLKPPGHVKTQRWSKFCNFCGHLSRPSHTYATDFCIERGLPIATPSAAWMQKYSSSGLAIRQVTLLRSSSTSGGCHSRSIRNAAKRIPAFSDDAVYTSHPCRHNKETLGLSLSTFMCAKDLHEAILRPRGRHAETVYSKGDGHHVKFCGQKNDGT